MIASPGSSLTIEKTARDTSNNTKRERKQRRKMYRPISVSTLRAGDQLGRLSLDIKAPPIGGAFILPLKTYLLTKFSKFLIRDGVALVSIHPSSFCLVRTESREPTIGVTASHKIRLCDLVMRWNHGMNPVHLIG